MLRHIEFERLHNFRDMGGYRTSDGRRVRRQRLYRSDSLGKLQGEDWQRYLALGVRTVIDLRYPWEIAARGRVPDYQGLEYHNLSIEHRPYDQAEIDPGVDPWRYLADRFAEVAADGTAEIRQALETVAAAPPAPVVIHCASGKDRTGLLAALLLALLGVGEDDILADFALTELASERLVADWRTANPERTLKWPAFGRAPAKVMRLVLDDLAAVYGSVHDYAVKEAGVREEVIETLRARYLVRE
ncbi:tyrosine-protein phosphatase [Streptantibioticus cattleyicolor]|uniref:Conventional protein tyrosine phosphatase n=1 Tax=Streptantibioticus cattleyicolor (strain ATCC 35852 / DSM 46488 / JCM 4925 / NBRC 14057 / NRRL 8057) TaxID=1003195 RepID=F8JIT7_STREN